MLYAVKRDSEGYISHLWKGNGKRITTVPRDMVQVCARGYALARVQMTLERKKRARDTSWTDAPIRADDLGLELDGLITEEE